MRILTGLFFVAAVLGIKTGTLARNPSELPSGLSHEHIVWIDYDEEE